MWMGGGGMLNTINKGSTQAWRIIDLPQWAFPEQHLPIICAERWCWQDPSGGARSILEHGAQPITNHTHTHKYCQSQNRFDKNTGLQYLNKSKMKIIYTGVVCFVKLCNPIPIKAYFRIQNIYWGFDPAYSTLLLVCIGVFAFHKNAQTYWLSQTAIWPS